MGWSESKGKRQNNLVLKCCYQVWRRSNALQATACPYCRQRITIILPYFSQVLNYLAPICSTGNFIYLVAKKNRPIPEYWQRCLYPWTGRKRHSRSGRDWAEERIVDRSAHLQQAILRRAENSPWNDQVWENKWCDISVSLLFRDLPVLLRHLVHYLLSGEGLHLAFQLRFFRNLNLSIWT